MKAKGTGTVKRWEEITYVQLSPEMKMTKAAVEYGFGGEIEGKASVEYLMFYSHSDETDPHKSSASYVGLIYFSGTMSGRSGAFVLEDSGTFEGGTVNAVSRIAKGSGTGDLEGIHGTGSYTATQDGLFLEVDYDLM